MLRTFGVKGYAEKSGAGVDSHHRGELGDEELGAIELRSDAIS